MFVEQAKTWDGTDAFIKLGRPGWETEFGLSRTKDITITEPPNSRMKHTSKGRH